MNRTTSIMVAIAVIAVLGALWMAPRPLPPASFEDTGEPLFAQFTDPEMATGLEVVAWDAEAAKLKQFKVEQKQGRWTIPSHHDYPADGAEHMGKAAASFIDVKRDIYYGDKAEDHGKFGVLAPDAEGGDGDDESGRGRRITLTDASGGKLVDIVVGKQIPDKQGFYYVRFPDQKRVYGSRLELDISTEFTDWIEKDLLRMTPEDVVTMIYDPYRVDEARGQVSPSVPVRADRSPGEGGAGSSDWQLSADSKPPTGKVLDSWKVQQMLSAMDGLQIVGVRPRPKPLTLQALQSKGFFVTPDGRRLFGNEGEASAVTDGGIVYTLYFGEVTFDEGLALTAGTAGDSGGASGADDKSGDAKANRYLFVDVRYDASLDKSVAAAAAAGDKPADGADKPAAGDKSAGDKPAADKPAEDPGAANREQAQRLQKRFDEWFYVISDDSFKRIHVERDELFKEPPEDAGK